MRRSGLLVVAALAAGCVGGGTEVNEPVPTLFDDSTSTVDLGGDEATSSTASTTTLPISERLPELSEEIPGAVRTDDGLLLPITGTDGDVWFVLGPCGEERIEPAATAMQIGSQHVVLDPGGGDDAAGQVNLAVAQRTAEMLEVDGVAVALTRTGPVSLSAATRGAAAPATGAAVFVSIQRGTGGATTSEAPRPTVFRRADDASSTRLAGLINEEVVDAFSGLEGEFVVHDEPGVRVLLNQRGDDYFRVLQTSAGVAGARVEMLSMAENETALLGTEEGRDIEARALADAIVRYLVSNEEGNGFIDPFETVRAAPTSNTPGDC